MTRSARPGLRRAVPLARNALEGVADLDSFLKMGDVTSVPKMGRALTDKVGILKRNARLVAAEGISADFIKEGERLAEALSAADLAAEAPDTKCRREGGARPGEGAQGPPEGSRGVRVPEGFAFPP